MRESGPAPLRNPLRVLQSAGSSTALPPAGAAVAMRAALQDTVTNRADGWASWANVAAGRAQAPRAGHDRLAAGLELHATAAAHDQDAHDV